MLAGIRFFEDFSSSDNHMYITQVKSERC